MRQGASMPLRRGGPGMRSSSVTGSSIEAQSGRASAVTGEEAVRVAVRVRPFNTQEQLSGLAQKPPAVALSSPGGRQVVVQGEDGVQQFSVDHVFFGAAEGAAGEKDGASQEDVFEELGLPMLWAGMAGTSTCLLAHGATGAGKSHSLIGSSSTPGVLPRLLAGLLKDQRNDLDEPCLWLSVLEVREEMVRDLLAAPPLGAQNVKEPLIVDHPMLGLQVVGIVEAPCLEVRDLWQYLDFAAKRRAMFMTSLHASAGKSSICYRLRLDRQGKAGGSSHFLLVDLAGAEFCAPSKSRNNRTSVCLSTSGSLSMLQFVVRELVTGTVAAPDTLNRVVPFQASKLTLLLKDVLSGNCRTIALAAVAPGRGSELESAATLRFGECLRKLRTSPRSKQLSRVDALTALQGEAIRLKSQLANYGEENLFVVRELNDHLTEIQVLREWMQQQLPSAGVMRTQLVENQQQYVEARGLCAADIDSCGLPEQVTPCLMNISDDPMLAGCLLYYLRCDGAVKIGSALDNNIVLDGVGVMPHHCEIINYDNVQVSLMRAEAPRRQLIVNGEVLKGNISVLELSHRDVIVFGRAVAMRLHVPLLGEVATIEECEELEVQPPLPKHDLVFRNRIREMLPDVPELCESFHQIQPLMDNSESLSELQLYMEDLYSKLDNNRGRSFFMTLQEACAFVDEANLITREIRPDDRIQFEVEFVWDICREAHDIFMIRTMLHHGNREDGSDILYYWTFSKFRERLDMMREAHQAFRQCQQCGNIPFSLAPVQDPWGEASGATFQQHIGEVIGAERRRLLAEQTKPLTSRIAQTKEPRERSPSAGRVPNRQAPGSDASSAQIQETGRGSATPTPRRATSSGRNKNSGEEATSRQRQAPSAVRRSTGISATAEKVGAAPRRVKNVPEASVSTTSSGPILVCTNGSVGTLTEASADDFMNDITKERMAALQALLQEKNELLNEKTHFIEQMREQMQVIYSMLPNGGIQPNSPKVDAIVGGSSGACVVTHEARPPEAPVAAQQLAALVLQAPQAAPQQMPSADSGEGGPSQPPGRQLPAASSPPIQTPQQPQWMQLPQPQEEPPSAETPNVGGDVGFQGYSGNMSPLGNFMPSPIFGGSAPGSINVGGSSGCYAPRTFVQRRVLAPLSPANDTPRTTAASSVGAPLMSTSAMIPVAQPAQQEATAWRQTGVLYPPPQHFQQLISARSTKGLSRCPSAPGTPTTWTALQRPAGGSMSVAPGSMQIPMAVASGPMHMPAQAQLRACSPPPQPDPRIIIRR